MKITERDASIKAAGITQSVIASGAPMDEWVSRSLFGMRVSIYLANRLQGKKPERPTLMKSERLKEKSSGN